MKRRGLMGSNGEKLGLNVLPRFTDVLSLKMAIFLVEIAGKLARSPVCFAELRDPG